MSAEVAAARLQQPPKRSFDRVLHAHLAVVYGFAVWAAAHAAVLSGVITVAVTAALAGVEFFKAVV